MRDECLGELGRSGKQQNISNCWKSTSSLGSPASSPILVSARAEGGTTDLCALGLACGRGRVRQVRVEVDDGERGRVCRLLGHLAIEQAIRRERERWLERRREGQSQRTVCGRHVSLDFGGVARSRPWLGALHPPQIFPSSSMPSGSPSPLLGGSDVVVRFVTLWTESSLTGLGGELLADLFLLYDDRVSSTLDKSVGKKYLTDGDNETCWTSANVRSALPSALVSHNLSSESSFSNRRVSPNRSPSPSPPPSSHPQSPSPSQEAS